MADPAGSKVLSIALIGPSEPRRWEVSSVLAECAGITVREFTSYPTALDDAPRLLERYFNVIIVDLDSDPEFALQLVASICAENSASVMVYSEKADRDLMARSTIAGAREYLVLPFDRSALNKALDRARAGVQTNSRPSQNSHGDLLVLFGAKGGAGVTTIACNLAIALAQDPNYRTLLIDLAVPLGDAALNLGIAAEHSTDDALRDGERLDAGLLLPLLARHRSGVYVLAAPGKVPEVEPSTAAVDRLVAVAREQFDHVIVDAGSRIDLMATDLFQQASTIYLVTQAGISELRNSSRLIAQFFSGGNSRLEIVLNRFAPHLQSGVNEEVVTKALAMPVRWKIPDDQDAARQMQTTATAQSPAASPIARLIREMASTVTGHPIPPAQGFVEDGSSRVAKETPALAAPAPEPAPAVQPPATSVTTPSVTWPAPDPIPYGTPLSPIQLNATASVPGTLVYTPGPGYLLPAGTHTLWVTFTPAHAAGSAPLQAAVSIAVSKGTPVLTWPAPAQIAFGTPLDSTHLNASASVPGEFVYHPAAGELLEVGDHSLAVEFTPADTTNYAVAQATASVTVGTIAPLLEWPEPGRMIYGEPLGAAQLNATASVAGEFVYSPSAGEVLAAGTHTLSAAFQPADSVHYSAADATVTMTVAKASPRLAWPQPEPIPYGEALGSAQLNATASVDGTFDYNPLPGSLLAAGEHSPTVVFTPSDAANFETERIAVRLTVAKAAPAIAWPSPDPIPAGTALSAAQLNATAPVRGSFTYSPSAGDVLSPGGHTLSVTFLPDDGLNSSVAQASVSLMVVETSPVEISWQAPSPISYGAPLGGAELNATASVPGSFSYSPAAGHVLAPGRYTLSVAFTPDESLRYTSTLAEVELQVEEPASLDVPFAGEEEVRPEPVSAPAGEFHADMQQQTAFGNTHRETRSYRGAIYERGDDGQWHLQQN